jgi:outer membrane protein TolC
VPSGSAINRREIEIEIEQIRARLVANEVERKELEAVLNDLLSRRPRKPSEIRQANPVMDPTIVTTASSGAEDRTISASICRSL